MLVKRTSTLTGKTNFREIPIDTQELLDAEISGKYPQSLTSGQLRYLNSGITPEEWEEQMTKLDEEDDSDPDKRYHR